MMFPFRERPPVLARPKNLFAYSEQDVSIARLAAAYAKGIVANHPFLDGDKRISFTVSLIFLMLNGLEVTATNENRVPTFWGHEAGEISEEQLVLRFERNMAPR
jgi:death-on-curing protein